MYMYVCIYIYILNEQKMIDRGEETRYKTSMLV